MPGNSFSRRAFRVVLQESNSGHLLFKGVVKIAIPRNVSEPEIFAMAVDEAAKEANLREDDDFQGRVTPARKKK